MVVERTGCEFYSNRQKFQKLIAHSFFLEADFNPMQNTGDYKLIIIINIDKDSKPALSEYLWKGFVHQLKRYVFVTKFPPSVPIYLPK